MDSELFYVLNRIWRNGGFIILLLIVIILMLGIDIFMKYELLEAMRRLGRD